MTSAWLRDAEDHLLQRLGAAAHVFCCLDYDGTLAPLAPSPDEAAPLPGTAALLRQLTAAPGTAVAVVTGRTIDDVRRFLDVPGVYYVGIHGLEVRLPTGEMQAAADGDAMRPTLQKIAARLRDALGSRPGILIEDKGAALACHYRLASPSDAAMARALMAALAQEYERDGIALIYGHEVAELRPQGVSKGQTVCALLAAHGANSLAVYIGDDETDEDAFRMMPPDAVTIRVAPVTTTAARYVVTSPVEVQHFLRSLALVRSHPMTDRLGACA